MTQADVAAALDEPQSVVANYKYENGERRIDVVEFVDIAAALSISTESILKKIESSARERRVRSLRQNRSYL